MPLPVLRLPTNSSLYFYDGFPDSSGAVSDWLPLNTDATYCLKDSLSASAVWFNFFCVSVSFSNLMKKYFILGPSIVVCFELDWFALEPC